MMDTMQNAVKHYEQQYQSGHGFKQGHELDWLQAMRAHAIAEFSELGFPTKRHEAWKYTSVHGFLTQDFQLPEKAKPNNVLKLLKERHALLNKNVYTLVFIDGFMHAELSDVDALPEGVIVTNLVDASQQHASLWHDVYRKSPAENGFAALNVAMMQDGLFCYIPKNVQLEKPIQCLFISSSGKMAQHINNTIFLAENSQASLIETYIAETEDAYFTNIQTQITLAENAGLTHYKVQNDGDAAFHIAKSSVVQARDSRFTSHSFAFGAATMRSDIQVDFNAPGASATLNGLYTAVESRHVDHHTELNHNAPHCQSQENYKGIITDKAKAVFNGKIVVAIDAQKTDAELQNKNLLLSNQAEINTKPELEIYADDVKCAHGTTVGQLDEDAVFYLQARGINKELAKQLLLQAFANELVEEVPHSDLRTAIQEQVDRVLEQMN